MNYRQTKHQVARGAFPDACNKGKSLSVQECFKVEGDISGATVDLFGFRGGKKLVINVPQHFKPHPTLSQLLKEFPKTIRIEKTHDELVSLHF